jgi:hypothetical protein
VWAFPNCQNNNKEENIQKKKTPSVMSPKKQYHTPGTSRRGVKRMCAPEDFYEGASAVVLRGPVGPTLQRFKGTSRACTQEEFIGLMEIGEDEYARRHGLSNRYDIIYMLRYATKHYLSLAGEATLDDSWEWVQLKLQAVTAARRVEKIEQRISAIYGELLSEHENIV